MLAERSWGVQLWDQTSNLIKYQECGIALHEKLQKFIIEMAKMQIDSFSTQKRICEKALINIKKVVGLETTFGQGYNAFVHAIAKLIDTENILPVSFNLQANGEMKQSIEEERKSMKQWRQDRDRFQNETKNQARIIDEEIKRYHEKYRDVTRSKEDYDRIDMDKSYSKMDVEKALVAYTQRHNDFKRARSDYSAALDQFNLHRRYHYNTTLRNWGEAGQTLESYRITKTQETISVLVERLRVMIERLVTVAADLESAAAMMDAEKDSTALIERLKTGNDPPGDVPIIHLDITDPPISSNQVGGRSAGDNGCTEPSVRSRLSSISIENGGSESVSSAVGRGSSPFVDADPIVEPYEAHRLHTTPNSTHSYLSRSSRRFSMSTMGLGSNGNTSGHSSFLWKVFARRSKSRETEKRSEVGIHGRRTPKSQLQRDSPKKTEIVHVGHEEAKESVIASSSDLSDAYVEPNPSIPAHIPRSASLFKPSGSAQEMNQTLTEQSRSLPSPPSNVNNIHGSKPKLNCPLPASDSKSRSPERYQIGINKNPPLNSAQFQKDLTDGRCSSSHVARQNTQEIISQKQKVCHQPKRQRGSNLQFNRTIAENKISHRSAMGDLIAVGTCKALYDFESSQYGDTFISFKQGDQLRVISSSVRWHGNPDTDGWIYAETLPHTNDPKTPTRRGFIPAAFVEINLFPEPIPLSSPRRREVDENINYKGSHSNLRSNKTFLALGQATEL